MRGQKQLKFGKTTTTTIKQQQQKIFNDNNNHKYVTEKLKLTKAFPNIALHFALPCCSSGICIVDK